MSVYSMCIYSHIHHIQGSGTSSKESVYAIYTIYRAVGPALGVCICHKLAYYTLRNIRSCLSARLGTDRLLRSPGGGAVVFQKTWRTKTLLPC